MRSTGARVGLLIVLVAVAVGLFVVLSDDDGDDGDAGSNSTAQTTTNGGQTLPVEPAPEAIVMNDGKVVGGVRTLTYEKGDEIWLRISLDEAQEEIHIHGYEIEKLNPPRGLVDLRFPAKLDGVYEVEAHGPDGDVVLAELRVNP